MKFSDSSGGMLLYVIITAMVVSFTCATIVMVSLNQGEIAEMGKMRIEAYQLVRAGFEYAYDLLGNATISDLIAGGLINDDWDGTYSTTLPSYSDVLIEINPTGSTDPAGVNYRIEVSTQYG